MNSDSYHNLTKVIYPDKSFRQYHYENTTFFHALTGITNENGNRYATFTYAADGKAILTQHAETDNGDTQEKFTLSYDSDTQTTVTDAFGTVEVLTYAENMGVKNLLSRINKTDQKGRVRSYDAQNNLISNTDAEGSRTRYGYNSNNQLTSITEASGDAEELITQMTYLSPVLDLPTQITKPSVVAGQSFQTDIQYNPDHTVKDITLKGYQPDGTAISRSTAFQYNTAGQVTQIDGPLTAVNDVTTLSYYQCTTGAHCGQLARVSNALGHSTSYDNYDNNGRIKQTTSAVGVITHYNYDVRGRLTQIQHPPPAGQGAPRTTVYSYDDAGQLLTITTPDKIVLSYSYDAAHDLRSISDNLGNRVEYRYDSKGNQTDENIKDASGTLLKTIQISYDHRNHLKTLNHAGSVTQFIHDAIGNRVSEIDPNQNPETTHNYDALHRLQQTIDTLGNGTDFQYDSHDKLNQVQAPNGIITQYAYDDFGQLIQETSADRGITHYQYDLAGNLLSKTNANNITSSYSYDALNRVTAIDFPGTEQDISYLYDNCNNGINQLCSVADNHSQSTYQYDPWGNRTKIVNTIGTNTYTAQYRFDEGDKLQSTTYPSGLQLAYQRDAIGRISDITSTWASISETIASQIDYFPFGPLQSMTFGNGLQEQRNYDQAYRLTEQTTSGIQDRVYGYDAAGNVLTIDQEAGATPLTQATRSYRYQYDALHRIIDETGAYGQRSYSYDENDNRLSRDKIDQMYDQQNLPTTAVTRYQNYSYPANEQHLTQISTDKNGTTRTVDLTYDLAGNTLSKKNKAFSYDVRNRIKSFSKKGKLIAEYRYNAQGERIEKIKHKTNGTKRTIHFHYDQQGQLLGLTRYNNAGLLKTHKDFIWVDNLPVAQITTRYKNDGAEKSRQLIYLHTDHLNTPRLATDKNQIAVWSWDSDAFGQGKPDTDLDQDGKKTFVPLRFPGQLASEGGLYYNYYRYYDPNTGRYSASDPIGLQGGLNTYAYVGGNPLTYIDPFGLDSISLTTNIGIPSFVVDFINPALDGFTGFHAGIAIEFPGINGGQWDFGGFWGADFGLNLGLGKATLNLGYDLAGLCDLANDSGEISALFPAGEIGISGDPDTGEFQGLHFGAGLAPGKIFSFIKNRVKGNSFARAYVNNMVSVGLSKNIKASSLRRGRIK